MSKIKVGIGVMKGDTNSIKWQIGVLLSFGNTLYLFSLICVCSLNITYSPSCSDSSNLFTIK